MTDLRVLLSAWVDAEQLRHDMCVDYFMTVWGAGGETTGPDQLLTDEALVGYARIDEAVAAARNAYFLALQQPRT
jgi:hypothetical protein